jgi:hypothetical protein
MAIGIFLQTTKGVLENQNMIEEMQFEHPQFCLAIRITEDQLPQDEPPAFYYRTFRSRTSAPKHFAVITVPRFMNPWRLTAMENWRQIMGGHVIDWFLPFRQSPCSRHTDPDTFYPLGSEFEKLCISHLARPPKQTSAHESPITPPAAAHLSPEDAQSRQHAAEV